MCIEELPTAVVKALEQKAAAQCLVSDSGAAAIRMLRTSKRAYVVRREEARAVKEKGRRSEEKKGRERRSSLELSEP